MRFEERAKAAGLDFHMTYLAGEQGATFKVNLYDHGCGAVVGDVDGDGLDDVFFLNQLGPNALFKSHGDGTFEDITKQAGGIALADRICVAGAFGDYDSDGDQDLYVTSTRGGNVLFRNRGDGTFEDVSKAAGVELVLHSQSASFFDYDGDGNLDLFVTNTAEWTTSEFDAQSRYFVGKSELFGLVDSPPEENVMFHNRGDGTFEDVTEQLGLGGTSWGGDIAAFDYDDDGDFDLFVTNMFGASKLYRNDDAKHFTDVRAETLGRTSWGTIGARLLDVNCDGRLDLALADMHSDMWMPSDFLPALIEPGVKYPSPYGRFVEMYPSEKAGEDEFIERLGVDMRAAVFGNTLFVAKGDGTFEEVSEKAGFETFWPWGIATGDFDQDGREDVYLPTGMGFPYFYWPSSLMMNRGDGTFANAAATAGVALPAGQRYLKENIGGRRAPRSSRCAATADFDGDGRLDIVANNFNDVPFLYMNRSPERSWVGFRLTGTRSNRDAIGAVIHVTAGGTTQVRQVQGAGGYLSQSTLMAHFGLGDAKKLERVEIRWPSGQTTELTDVAVGEVHAVTEPR